MQRSAPFVIRPAYCSQAGVERVLAWLRAESERDMMLMGVSKIADMNPSFLAVCRRPWREAATSSIHQAVRTDACSYP